MHQSNYLLKTCVISLCALLTIPVFAKKNVATITRLKGDVQLLTNARSKPTGKGPWIKYEKMFYKLKKARVGSKLKNGNVLQSFGESKAMLIYPNGDQINLAPGSAYEISWDKSKKEGNTKIRMFYGRIRGVVSKTGPRKKLRIITPTAVAGVRGTDFSVSSSGSKTEVNVIRGKVELRPKSVKAKAVQITQGVTGQVQMQAQPPSGLPEKVSSGRSSRAPKIEYKPTAILKQTSKEKLVQIQNESTVKKTQAIDLKAGSLETDLSETEKAELKESIGQLSQLESKATENVLQEIKVYEPEQYQKIIAQETKPADVTEINTAVVAKLFKAAPAEEPKKSKFSEDDFDDLETNYYDKYFKE
ncbi:MAG: FecR domain-containing protein [Bdellovibrionales bacterium]